MKILGNHMIEIDIRTRPVRDLVLEEGALAHVFERYGIDYCCHGEETLEVVCVKKDLDVQVVLREIEMTGIARPYSFLHCNLWDTEFLIEYIVNNHHRFCKAAIPVLLAQLSKLNAEQSNQYFYIKPLLLLFQRVSGEIEQHIRKEEMILFPYIKTLASAAELNRQRPIAPFFTIAGPIEKMEEEHHETAQVFAKIRALLSDFAVPEGACGTHRSVIKGLQAFVYDMHQHVHLENNLLFPRVRDLERSFDTRKGE
jgi:regulator of cell morphogenesis and NO signaling